MELCQSFSGNAEIKQFDYYTRSFKEESYDISFLNIDETKLSAEIRIQSCNPFNVSLLLLDRIVQSLGFFTVQHLRSQQSRPVRFIFIRQMDWQFSGPIRPAFPVIFNADYSCCDLTAKKQDFQFHGTINNRAGFSLSIDVISFRPQHSVTAPHV